MNKYNLFAINKFRSGENRTGLKKNLLIFFGNDENVGRYLDKMFDEHVDIFASQAEKDLMYTDTVTLQYMDEQDPAKTVICLNNKFFQYMIQMINGDFLNVKKCKMQQNVPVYSNNDGLNVTHQTIVSAMPRSVLCDKDTRAVDNQFLNYAAAGDWQRCANQVADDDVNALRFRRIDYDKNPYNSRDSARSYYDCGYGDVARSADIELNKWWYNRRGNTIRDDPVGEINRDRIPYFSANSDCTPAQYEPLPKLFARNQNEFPYGNAGGWRNGYYNSSESNKNEAQTLSNSQIFPNSSLKFRGSSQSGAPRQAEGFQSRGQQPEFRCKKTVQYNSGNSNCAYRAGNHEWGNGYDYQGVDNDSNDSHGNYNNKFTGEDPEYTYDPTSHLLNTPYIQTLNDQYGNDAGKNASENFNVIRSTFIRGKYGAADVTAERPQNNVKLWRDGDGFVDQSNPKAMEKLINRRVFRSFNLGRDCHGNPSTRYGDKHGDYASEQIPWFERALYNRYYERDVEEALGGFELDGMNRGYGKDMQSLYCRLPNYPVNARSQTSGHGQPGGNANTRKEYRMPGGYNDRTNNPQWEFLYKFY